MSPTVSTYLNVVPAILGVLAVMAPSAFPSYIPPGVAADIIQTAGFVTALWTGINSVLHGKSTAEAGPLAK